MLRLVEGSEKDKEMFEALWLVPFLIALTITAILAYPYVTRIAQSQKTRHQGIIKRDWLPTGRIDFATRSNEVGDRRKERPAEFKLLVEERRIVESSVGNENLEIQWRLATLSEAKAVVTQYHKYLSENSLIKPIPDLSISSPPPKTLQGSPSARLHSVSSPPLATA
jgi:hypothetical protein